MKHLAVSCILLITLALAASANATPPPGVLPPNVPAKLPVIAPQLIAPEMPAKQPIHYSTPEQDFSPAKDKAVQIPSSGMDPLRVTLALAGVLGLIFLLRWMMKKVAPGVVGARGTRAMKVLSRCTISPRQHLLLIQVGRRLVVVGEGGAQLNTLSEITDAEEVSALLLQVGEENTSTTSRFTSIFTRARKDFDPDTDAEKYPEPNRDIAAEAQDSDDETDPTEAPDQVDPTIAATSQELAGLSVKVRGLARQLGRG